MSRLEAVEIKLSDLKIENEYFRIDSEFFKKTFVELDKKMRIKECYKISDIAIVTDGEHGSPILDDNSNIVYLSGNNILENMINFDDVRYCALELHNKNLRSALIYENVLMSIVGTVGRAAVFNKNIIGNTDRNVATIKKLNECFNPYYLSTFLNCKYGKFQTKRFSTGNVQPLLNLLQVKNMRVRATLNIA